MSAYAKWQYATYKKTGELLRDWQKAHQLHLTKEAVDDLVVKLVAALIDATQTGAASTQIGVPTDKQETV